MHKIFDTLFLHFFLAGVLLWIMNCSGHGNWEDDAKLLTEPMPCDSTYSVYYKEKSHYFHGDYVHPDGTLNKKKWWKEGFRSEKSPCSIPLERQN